MKYLIYSLIILLFCSCNKVDEPDNNEVKKILVTLNYSTSKYVNRPIKSRISNKEFLNRGDSIYNKVFKSKIESGELLGDSIYLKFTNTKNNDTWIIYSNQKGSILLPIGEYKVSGTIGVSLDEYYSNRGTLLINNVDVKITEATKNITLFGTLSKALIFSEDKFKWEYRVNDIHNNGDSAYTTSNYYYMFVKSPYKTAVIYIWDSKYEFPVYTNTYYYFTKDVNMLDYLSNLTNAFK